MDSPLPALPKLRSDLGAITPEREGELRARVIEAARRWIGTPYRQQGARLGAGIDCAMLLVRAWVDAGIVEEFDPRPYPPEWHMHRGEERYLAWMKAVAEPVEAGQPGDVALWRFGRCFSHAAVITRPGVVVHAIAGHSRCLETEIDEPGLQYEGRGTRIRPRLFFDVWARLRTAS